MIWCSALRRSSLRETHEKKAESATDRAYPPPHIAGAQVRVVGRYQEGLLRPRKEVPSRYEQERPKGEKTLLPSFTTLPPRVSLPSLNDFLLPLTLGSRRRRSSRRSPKRTRCSKMTRPGGPTTGCGSFRSAAAGTLLGFVNEARASGAAQGTCSVWLGHGRASELCVFPAASSSLEERFLLQPVSFLLTF